MNNRNNIGIPVDAPKNVPIIENAIKRIPDVIIKASNTFRSLTKKTVADNNAIGANVILYPTNYATLKNFKAHFHISFAALISARVIPYDACFISSIYIDSAASITLV